MASKISRKVGRLEGWKGKGGGQWLVKAVFSGETVASEGNGEWEDWKGGRREEKQWKWREREGVEEGVIV